VTKKNKKIIQKLFFDTTNKARKKRKKKKVWKTKYIFSSFNVQIITKIYICYCIENLFHTMKHKPVITAHQQHSNIIQRKRYFDRVFVSYSSTNDDIKSKKHVKYTPVHVAPISTTTVANITENATSETQKLSERFGATANLISTLSKSNIDTVKKIEMDRILSLSTVMKDIVIPWLIRKRYLSSDTTPIDSKKYFRTTKSTNPRVSELSKTLVCVANVFFPLTRFVSEVLLSTYGPYHAITMCISSSARKEMIKQICKSHRQHQNLFPSIILYSHCITGNVAAVSEIMQTQTIQLNTDIMNALLHAAIESRSLDMLKCIMQNSERKNIAFSKSTVIVAIDICKSKESLHQMAYEIMKRTATDVGGKFWLEFSTIELCKTRDIQSLRLYVGCDELKYHLEHLSGNERIEFATKILDALFNRKTDKSELFNFIMDELCSKHTIFPIAAMQSVLNACSNDNYTTAETIVSFFSLMNNRYTLLELAYSEKSYKTVEWIHRKMYISDEPLFVEDSLKTALHFTDYLVDNGRIDRLYEYQPLHPGLFRRSVVSLLIHGKLVEAKYFIEKMHGTKEDINYCITMAIHELTRNLGIGIFIAYTEERAISHLESESIQCAVDILEIFSTNLFDRRHLHALLCLACICDNLYAARKVHKLIRDFFTTNEKEEEARLECTLLHIDPLYCACKGNSMSCAMWLVGECEKNRICDAMTFMGVCAMGSRRLISEVTKKMHLSMEKWDTSNYCSIIHSCYRTRNTKIVDLVVQTLDMRKKLPKLFEEECEQSIATEKYCIIRECLFRKDFKSAKHATWMLCISSNDVEAMKQIGPIYTKDFRIQEKYEMELFDINNEIDKRRKQKSTN
jgi:hypothetical protein